MQPFDKHPAGSGGLSGCGSSIADRAAGAMSAAGQTSQAYQPAIANWSGMCAPQLVAAQQPLQASAEAVSAALVWAGVVAEYWSKQVSEFNSRVDEIVSELNSMGPNFGASGKDGKPPTPDAIEAARALAVNEAKRKWWQAHERYIGNGEDRVTSMLSQGPTLPNIRHVEHAGIDEALQRIFRNTVAPPFGPLGPILPLLGSPLFGLPTPKGSAGFRNRNGQTGPYASVSIEKNLLELRKKFRDSAGSTLDLAAKVGAKAGASAEANVGPNGVHLGAGVEARAGAEGSLGGAIGQEDTVQVKPEVGVWAGPGFEAGGNLDVDSDGIDIGGRLGASPIVGGKVEIDIHVDPVGIAESIMEAPRNIEKVKDVLGLGD